MSRIQTHAPWGLTRGGGCGEVRLAQPCAEQAGPQEAVRGLAPQCPPSSPKGHKVTDSWPWLWEEKGVWGP